ncbi:MAG TPA: carbohydrate ABC transporter permease [Candidatus Eisenbergiella stercorigallinarum]|uniref:Carbohydrate ABC transporter permease n=1 Tax=Candidatus Eisenbergiella stercorigallinarum TaxID=2838557 RepID=A0A9D2R1B7_9FIRM|nr:carbohydrate ABC transporter permease [Candidatus Eisenbergiella stercorigallinarum]
MKDKALMRSKMKRFIARFIVYVFAFGIAVTAFYPFFVMIISSTHDSYDIVARANVLPGTHFAENYARLTQNIDLYRGIANSLFLAVVVTAVQCYFTVLAAYGFSKFEFKGKNFLFSVVMVAMMLPGQLGIIGFYKEIQAMNLLNSYIPLVIPTIANCFAVFFYKQFMDGAIPNELLEAAVMDGCGELKMYHRIVLPLMLPALVTQGVMTFIGSWNSYLNPLIILNDKEKFTLPLMIATVRDSTHADYGAQYVGMLVSVIPMVIVFCFASRVIMEKISIGAAVKG